MSPQDLLSLKPYHHQRRVYGPVNDWVIDGPTGTLRACPTMADAQRSVHDANHGFNEGVRRTLAALGVSPDAPQIAPGHNPSKLTVAQVGEGWRLLNLDEVENKRRHPTWEIQAYEGGWDTKHTVHGNTVAMTYRTKLSREALAAITLPSVAPFKAGDYVVYIGTQGWLALNKPMKVTETYADDSIGIGNTLLYRTSLFRAATPDEISIHLIAEAEAKGFKVGALVLIGTEGSRYEIRRMGTWLPGDASLWGFGGTYMAHAIKPGVPFAYAIFGDAFMVPVKDLTLAPAPKPLKRVPMEGKDYPATVWIRLKGLSLAVSTFYLVNRIQHDSLYTDQTGPLYADVLQRDWEWSPDRVTWKPCWKEVES